MAKGYMFWDWNVVETDDSSKVMSGHDQGTVVQCAHVPRVISSVTTQTGFKWYNPETFSNNKWINGTNTLGEGSYTAGRAVASVNHIIAMKKAGWIEYNPFASRMSAFYDKAWKYWEPHHFQKEKAPECPEKSIACSGSVSGVGGVATIQGFGTSGDDAHFAGTPLGYRILPTNSKTNDKQGTSVFPAGALESIITNGKDSYWLGGKKMKKNVWTGDVFDIPEYDSYETLTASYKVSAEAANTCSEWALDGDEVTRKHKVSCKSAAMGLADNMYSWVEGSIYRINVVNRMLQREALAFAQTSGFTTIIVVQWADLMICKTRWLSIRQQGMSNPLMNFGLLFETILGAAVCFVPFLNIALQTRPLRLTHWFPGMPFMVLIFLYDETRKYLMRSGGLGIPPSVDKVDEISGQVKKVYNWVGENTYY
jgi:hypothetical protein